MESNQKFFTKAFYIALIATLILTVGAIIGKFILGGDITKALLVVLPSIAALWIFMLVIRKARSSSMDADADKWGIIEKVLMVAFWILIVIVPVNYFVYGFCTMFSSSSLQAAAQSDVTAVQKLYDDYEDFRTTALDKAAQDIKNYIKSGDSTDAVLLKFVSEKVTNTMDENQVNKWQADAEDFTEFSDDAWSDFQSELNNFWGIQNYNYFAKTLSDKCGSVKSEIANHISEYGSNQSLIPVIEDENNSGKYKWGGLAIFDGLENAPVNSEFADRIFNPGSMLAGNVVATVFGVILGLILALAVFLFALNPKEERIKPRRR